MTDITARPLTEVEVTEIAKFGRLVEVGTTIGALIVDLVGIGYGGHLDEMSDDEDAIYDLLASDADEYLALHAARDDYTDRCHKALQRVAP